MKLYVAVLDEFPDYMTPTLVAHAVLGHHLVSNPIPDYDEWLRLSFRKVVLRVNQKEFDKIIQLPKVTLWHENKTLDGRKSCAVWLDNGKDVVPNVLKYAKLWKPKESQNG